MRKILFNELGTFKSSPNQSEYNIRHAYYCIKFKKNKVGDVVKFHMSRQVLTLLGVSESDRRIQIHPYKGGLVIYKTKEDGFLISLLGYGAVNQKQLANEIYAYMDFVEEISIDAVEEITLVKGKQKYHAIYIHI